MGAWVGPKLVMVCGTPSSMTLKFSCFSPGTNIPSFVNTPTSSVTSGTFTRIEKSGMPSTFLGGFGVSSFLGSSAFFLGTAMGPMSPCGPPASGGAFCWFCCCPLGCCDPCELDDWPCWFCAQLRDVVSARTSAITNIRWNIGNIGMEIKVRNDLNGFGMVDCLFKSLVLII